MQNAVSTSIMSQDLKISEPEIEAYYRNYYINRTLPIRDLTPDEIKLVRYYNEVKFYAKDEIVGLCTQYELTYEDYLSDMWILPKEIIKMPDAEYMIAKKYASILLEPYVNYGNYRAPRLTPLTKEEIAMLLSNIAVGITILPEDQITTRISMEAMDRLLNLYEALPKEAMDKTTNDLLKNLSPKKLEALINQLTAEIEVKKVVVPKDLKTNIKKPREKKQKNNLKK